MVAVTSLLVVRAAMAVRVEGLVSLPDEVGYLGNAWLLGRGEPAPPMAFSPFYAPGLGVVLAPVAAVVEDPGRIQAIARLVDVALLAAVVPVLAALLARFGRLSAPGRVLAALVAAAAPGLWVASVTVWPDALMALLWPLGLLALHRLARGGAGVGMIWFGPIVAALWVAHPRFLPVVLLGAMVLVLRLVWPGPGAGDAEGVRGRRSDLANLGLGALVVLAGVWLDRRVGVRWEVEAPDAIARTTDAPWDTALGAMRALIGR